MLADFYGLDHKVLSTLAFFLLGKASTVCYEEKETGVHLRESTLPEGSWVPRGLLTPVFEAFFSAVNCIGLFEIVPSNGLDKSKS